ncbi:hypothetical protein [Saccharothrix stipae]
MRVWNRSVVVGVMTAAMAFGAAAPALALDDGREVSAGGGTDVVAASDAGAEVGIQGRKWGIPWW